MALRWPNLFVVGAPKGGTTTLWLTDEHPDVFMSPEKEPNFFLDLTPPVKVPTEDVYLRLAPGADDERWLGERERGTSPDTTTPGLIKARVPDARIMIALRDPVERGYSSYWHDVKFGIESRPSPKSWMNSSTNSRLPVGADPEQSTSSASTKHVARFLEVFGDAAASASSRISTPTRGEAARSSSSSTSLRAGAADLTRRT